MKNTTPSPKADTRSSPACELQEFSALDRGSCRDLAAEKMNGQENAVTAGDENTVAAGNKVQTEDPCSMDTAYDGDSADHPREIDFSCSREVMQNYGGTERKKKLIIDGAAYMVKFPEILQEAGPVLPGRGHPFSDFLGCHIFALAGIPAQATYLGEYIHRGRALIAVACSDFANAGLEVFPVMRLMAANLDIRFRFRNYIEDVYTFAQSFREPGFAGKIIARFWEMMVIDCLIATPDRSGENWGLTKDCYGNVGLAPVYDCGACLHPMIAEDEMQDVLMHPQQAESLFLHVPTPYRTRSGSKRLFYADIFGMGHSDTSHSDSSDLFVMGSFYADLTKAILHVVPRIHLDEIESMVCQTPFMTELHKRFVMESIKMRYNRILLPAYVKAMRAEGKGMDLQEATL